MELSVILPSYNEAENLTPLLRDLRDKLDKLKIQYELIVVDDGSTDNTQAILDSLKKEIPALKNIRIWPNSGFSTAVIRGLGESRGDALAFMDSDGQVDAKYLVEIFLKLKKDNLDICKGKRVKRNDGWQRKYFSKIYNFLFRLMFGGNFDDIGGKPKVFTRHFYEDIKPESKAWFIDNEFMIKAIKRGYKIGEFPVIFNRRQRGKSKVRPSTACSYLIDMLKWWYSKKY